MMPKIIENIKFRLAPLAVRCVEVMELSIMVFMVKQAAHGCLPEEQSLAVVAMEAECFGLSIHIPPPLHPRKKSRGWKTRTQEFILALIVAQ